MKSFEDSGNVKSVSAITMSVDRKKELASESDVVRGYLLSVII